MKKTIEILVGIPCSGKSTYAWNKYTREKHVYEISRDGIRDVLFPKPYIHSEDNENKVTEIFNDKIRMYLNHNDCNHLILDNTHCKEGYIDQIVQKYKDNYNIKITFIEVSLFKAFYRNIIRYFADGKWIPFKIIRNMYKNFNKINRQKYKRYI